MDFFSTSSWMIIGIIIAIGVVLAPVAQVVWASRFLMASYVAYAIVLLMPDKFAFNPYADAIFFTALMLGLALVEKWRLFDTGEWMTGRFSYQAFVLTVLTVFHLSALLCYFLPFSSISFFMTKEVWQVLTDYIFYFAIAPLVFVILFIKR
jgi:hypothetical protein